MSETMKTKLIICLLLFPLFLMAQPGNGFKNPVISGFHPDPSVCRVGDDYYLVTSSFEYFPGVPIFHSKDLIHWTQIGHCLTRQSQLPLQNSRVSGGIFAPTIRYHEGLFYMTTTNITGGGNFYVYTDDPAGEWSDPVWVDQGGIDPTIFFDEGRAYYLTTDGGIRMSEIDIKTGVKKGDSKVIWNGTGGRYPEAPHIYKKDGFYYLLISEGGTEYGHFVTIARSRSLWGPYASNPSNPILTHRDEHTQQNPIQGVGHADFVQATDGSWWLVCLAFRPQVGTHHLLGRETFLAPVRWDKDAWPVVNGNGSISLDMDVPTLPQIINKEEPVRDEFSSDKLSYKWNYLRNPNAKNYSLNAKNGFLRLTGTTVSLDDVDSPTFLGRRQEDISFEATTSLHLTSVNDYDQAGLTVFMNNFSHYDCYVTQSGGSQYLVLRCKLGHIDYTVKQIPIRNNVIQIRVVGTNNDYAFYYSEDEKTFTEIGKLDTRYLSTETAGGFTGVYLGLYAKGNAPVADFDWFEYKGK